MNIVKELVLGQKDMKRMGKRIRQRFSFIAGRLVRGGRKFIPEVELVLYRIEVKQQGRKY